MEEGEEEEEKGGGLRVYVGHLDLQAQCGPSPRRASMLSIRNRRSLFLMSHRKPLQR